MKTSKCPPRLTRGLPKEGRRKVSAAYACAFRHLSSIRRRTGASYAKHGTNIALVLREITSDPGLLCVALLHDIFLTPEGERVLASSALTREERRLARMMHALRRLHIDAKTHDLGKVIACFSSDERLIVLRMAHRLNDVRNLRDFTPHLRRAIALETLHMYTGIAGRLGMHKWRHEMEETCFRFLHSKIARSLEKKMRQRQPLDLLCITQAKRLIRRSLREKGIKCHTNHRIKGLYSTYRKMTLKNRSFEELTDRLALRLIVPSVEDCYRTLGIVHTLFHPIPGKLKDYIGAPKENGYRSIHTVVYPLRGVTEQPMEIQIRTGDMHAECELGIARHTDYKHYLNTLHRSSVRVNLFKNLLTLQAETRSPRQFANALRHYFDDGHIAIFDAKNNLYHMKKPVTALEFIERMQNGAKKRAPASFRVNGRIVPGTIVLQDGDTVEAVSRRR